MFLLSLSCRNSWGVDLLPHVENFLGARGKKFFRVWAPSPSFILTMQRYNILIAVHEYLPDFFQKNHTVTMVRVKMVKIELRCAINAQ